MAGKDIIEMRILEIKKWQVIQEIIGGHITQVTGALMLNLSQRQVRRLVRSTRTEGVRGVIHKLRGRRSNRKVSEEDRTKVLRLYEEKYSGFGPTLATEKLMEDDDIKISDETLRKWLLDAGLWRKRRRISSHRQWRQPKECFGEMLQIDGSHHDWLEGRGPKLVLMGYIDDATNNVYGRFYDYEGTMPAMDSFKRYMGKYGLPMSVYFDRHSTYKSTRNLTIEEELAGMERPMSQFERALNELGVEVIHALSPQAKGRIERLFGVLQDRLVKEMRLREIKTKEEANEFLEEYLPRHNNRFRVCPKNNTDVHVRPARPFDPDRYLCIKTVRTLRNDNTISLNGRLYQIEEKVNIRKVVTEERFDGVIRIVIGKKDLKYKELTERPEKEMLTKKPRKEKTSHVPPKDHPWRRQNSATFMRTLPTQDKGLLRS